MTKKDFKRLLARGYEAPGVEFKGPGKRSDKPFLAKVVRAVLGMANQRDGGLVIIGVSEEDGALKPEGLPDDHLKSWRDFDKVSEKLNGYASPCVVFDLRIQEYQGKQFAVLDVHEFRDIPILCCHDYDDPISKKQTLRKGACYVRSRHKPETSEVPSEEEMRELLELAVDKGVRKFVERARRVGFLPPTPPKTARSPDDPEAAENSKD